MIAEPATIRSALQRLKSLLGEIGEIDDNDAIALRLAELDIELTAVEQTAKRIPAESVKSNLVILKTTELGERIGALVTDMLAWQALPEPLPGDNEPAIGLRSEFMQHLAADEPAMMRLRDQLADYLARAGA